MFACVFEHNGRKCDACLCEVPFPEYFAFDTNKNLCVTNYNQDKKQQMKQNSLNFRLPKERGGNRIQSVT